MLPEGIAVHRDGTMYVSSDGTGALYKGHVENARLAPFPADGATQRGTSLGVHTDVLGRIWSVGDSALTVQQPSGRLVARRTAAGGPLEPWLDIRSALPGFPAQFWLLNGIVADRTGRTLLVASNGTDAVWRVDTISKGVRPLDLGDQSFGADGMVLDGRRLYAVLNYGAPAGVYVAELDAALRTGTVTAQIRHDADGQPFDLPTTLARHECRLYVVNSQLDEPPGMPPYTVSAVADPYC